MTLAVNLCPHLTLDRPTADALEIMEAVMDTI